MFEHLLEVEEEVEDSCRVEENFDHLAGCRALDQIFVHVDQVVNSAQKEHDAIKATAVGPLRLIASEDKYQSRDWQGDYDEPLRNLLHDHAIIVYQKDLLLDIDATFLFIIDPVCQQKAFKHYDPNIQLEATEKLCKEVISLPIHTEMNREIQDIIIEAVKSFYK